ncbi:hypothetical protein M5K25_026061 [Dendrobium thyrsiflorum]|uniref:Uncharacterized protein n=1 Tax=Dendrobium thyrsiflorum TaxID=117978 RepID=A0ABD0TWH4_DENTH
MHSSLISSNNSVLKYLSPALAKTVTIIFPLRKKREGEPTFKEAAKHAPDEIPITNPSSCASLLAWVIASAVVTVMISSMCEVSRISGTNPGPRP